MPENDSQKSQTTPFSFIKHSAEQVSLEDMLDHLENVQQSGDQYSARCPAHADSDNSLSFTKAGSRLLATCFAGCSFEDVVAVVKERKAGTEQRPKVRLATAADIIAAESASEGGGQQAEPDDDDEERSIHAVEWNERVEQFQRQLSDEGCQKLAESLGVSVPALRAAGVGWDPSEKVYTFPEVDAAGKVIGYVRRFENGEKKAADGGKRGLCIPANWETKTGPILIPEGPTDVAAAETMGLCAIGRPSATGGFDHLRNLLKSVPATREIIVVGERDQKADGKWPGKEAAEAMGKKLSDALGRSVRWVLPPEGKDLRNYLQLRPKDTDPAVRGRAFLDHVSKSDDDIDPRYRLEVISAPDLLSADLKPVWLIKHVLVAGQPAIIGGAKKALKTSLATDLAISLATVMPFLEYPTFQVQKKHRVYLLSGESGKATIQETIRRQLKAKNHRWESQKGILDNLYVGFRLPQVSVKESLQALSKQLSRQNFDVIIIDPLYLCLLAQNEKAQASNLYDMGPLLLELSEICLGQPAPLFQRKAMSMGLDESLRSFLKSVLVEVAKEVLPIALSHQELGNKFTSDLTSSEAIPLLWRPKEAAKALAISERHLWALSHAGKIPYVRLNRLVRYDPAALREWLKNPQSIQVVTECAERPPGEPESVAPGHSSSVSASSKRRISKARSPSKTPIGRRVRHEKSAETGHSRTQKSPTGTEERRANTQRDVRGYFGERLGISPSKLPVITNGKIMEITGLDIATLHGWIYKGTALPDEAIQKLQAFYAAATGPVK